MTWLDMATDALAVRRLTRLVTTDRLTAEAREETIRAAYAEAGSMPGDIVGTWTDWAQFDDGAPHKAVLISCDWCASVWFAVFAAIARHILPEVWQTVSRALAVAELAGILARIERP
jgi:hypothetical protein